MAQETSGIRTDDNVEINDSVDQEVLDAAGGTEELERARDEGDVDDETEVIRQRIDETRSDLSETIDAIQERLSISNISEQVSEQVNNVIVSAKDTVYDATLGKVVTFMKQASDGIRHTSAGRTVMSNPIPFALIGAGAAMLVYNSWGKSNVRKNPAGYRVKPYLTSEGREGQSGSIGGTLSNTAGSITEKAGSAVDSITSTASSAVESASNAASSTLVGAKDVVNRAYEKAGELGHTAQEQYEHYVEERPLAVAAAAAAVGVAIGLAIPSTRYEGELMGETRDNLLDKAGETANDLVAQAKNVANEAGRKLSQEAKNIGETGSSASSTSTGKRPSIQ
jgi:ElaB/YqjD/DUF883 family membrane-anchored ribosome-binding protein